MRKFVYTVVLLVCLETRGHSSLQTNRPSIGTPTGSFCALLVPNAKESAQWYQDYLGFSIVRVADGPNGASHTIMLEQDGVLLEIIEARDSFALQRVTQKKVTELQGIRKFGLVVEKDVFDGLHQTLVEKKATFVGGVFVDDGLKVRSFVVRDNSGNLVQFFSRMRQPPS
jgi:catechol 2,3-dioxygenase-like lactoylglutathione lyase family enzyme